ncbi:unnamed protein product [Caenorhabditis sp. 36 PRJEB53466]|nr:unnamed protein product [Caenorhabditis sp. 36 PRJEB53466]
MSSEASEQETFTRICLLGTGSFGNVLKVKSSKTNEVVAVKVFNRTTTKRESAMREFKTMRRLTHVNVVSALKFYEGKDKFYLLMELCEHNSLKELMTVRLTFTDTEAKFFMRDVLNGLIYLHAEGVVHRDVKLANLLLDLHLNVKSPSSSGTQNVV